MRVARGKRWALGLGAYGALELAFGGFYRWKRRQLSAERPEGPPIDAEAVAGRVLRDLRARGWGVEEYRHFLSEWFRGADATAIGEEDAHRWAAHMLFSKHPKELTEHERGVVGHTLRTLQDGAHVTFRPGSTSAQPMAHSFDPIEGCALPLAVYGVVGILQLVTVVSLRLLGFQRLRAGALAAWCSQPVPSSHVADGAATDPLTTPSPRPILLFPGLGIGLLPYLPLALRLRRDCGAPVLLVELPHISLSLGNFFRNNCVPSIHDSVEGTEALIRHTGHDSAWIVAHSYGTNYAVWAHRERPTLVAGLVLIDPIGFLLYEPDLVGNMLYRNRVTGPLSFLIRSELFVRYACQRHFWWMHNTLFPGDLPPHTAVLLASGDNIVPVHNVHRYLEGRPGLDCRMFSTRHGGVVWHTPMQDHILDTLTAWCRRSLP